MAHVPIAHDPELHDAPALEKLHACPHVPQLPRLVAVFVSHPFAGLLSQSPQPELHVPIAHDPLLHAAPAFAKLHALPQSPQLPTLALMFVSHPFAALPSQLPKPATHAARPHVPLVQAPTPLL